MCLELHKNLFQFLLLYFNRSQFFQLSYMAAKPVPLNATFEEQQYTNAVDLESSF